MDLQMLAQKLDTEGSVRGTLPDKSRGRISFTFHFQVREIQTIVAFKHGNGSPVFPDSGLVLGEADFGTCVANPSNAVEWP